MKSIAVVTGTDTGVGKTILTVMLTRVLLANQVPVAALKPVCSGGRGDALLLHQALRGALHLNEINPWSYRAAVAPLFATRRLGMRLQLGDVVSHIRGIAHRHSLVLVEGVGGLLSPIGEGFSTRELIEALDAIPVVVCPNRLGAIGQARLALTALSRRFRGRAHLALMSVPGSRAVASENRRCLQQEVGAQRVHAIPWMGELTDLGMERRAERLDSPWLRMLKAMGLCGGGRGA